VEGRVVALLGLSFKPETDDIREAPALSIAKALLERGAVVRAYDPVAIEEAGRMVPEMACCEDAYAALEGADAVAIVTEWNQFRMLDLPRVKALMKKPVMIDMRNIYNPARMRAEGFFYTGVGV
jgi:UDPglucose 6-dehydrogenase